MTHHNYIFFSSDNALHDMPKQKLETYRKQFLKVLAGDKEVITNTFTTLGLKAQTKSMIWFQADSIEAIQNLLNELLHTKLGKYLTITYTLFGMTRQTQYSSHATGHLDTSRKGGKYLIIYPFVKTQEWYRTDFESRRKLMGGHVMIGKKHSSKITQLLLYSYGIDDSEFLVSYETDDLSAFQTLVMELRSDKVREYTHRDTPIFCCVYREPAETLNFL
jgi:chlorite dismutase